MDWLLRSVDGKKPLAEKPYLLGQSDEDEPKKNGNAKKSEAEPEVKDEDEAEDEAAKKSDVIKKNDKKRGIKQEDDQTDESNKKQKDSQKVGFKSLNVPLEEAAVKRLAEEAPKASKWERRGYTIRVRVLIYFEQTLLC